MVVFVLQMFTVRVEAHWKGKLIPKECISVGNAEAVSNEMNGFNLEAIVRLCAIAKSVYA